ncbi:GtrA family protein [Xanthobacter sp. V4C-4]|uniref:GtrA family protein n=1 Tax=Xanthobacter cornucopiae TaxID=3119924 RepID=UPI00372B9A8E
MFTSSVAEIRRAVRRYRPLVLQVGSFAWVGLLATGAHFATLALVVEQGLAGPVLGSVMGSVVGAVVSYVLNRLFTFESSRSHAGAVPRFAVVALGAFALNALLMEVLAQRIGLYYLAAQVVATGVTLVWTFTGYRVWAFADRSIRRT